MDVSRVNELNDNSFALATEAAVELCMAFEEELGVKPSSREFAELLTWGIKGCSAEIFSDGYAADVSEVVVKFRRRKSGKLKRGDVVAIPSNRKNRFHHVVYLGGFGHFGDAFGIFKGCYPLRRMRAGLDREVYPCHKFVGIESVRSGRWKILENDVNLLGLFSPNPEYFHSKRYHPDNPEVGEFGSAESLSEDGRSSRIRKISSEESQTIGLNEADFEMVYLEEAFEVYLNSLNGD